MRVVQATAFGSPGVGEVGDVGVAGVVASVGEGVDRALARERGADVAVDYSEDGWVDRIRAEIGAAGVDVVFRRRRRENRQRGVRADRPRRPFPLLRRGERRLPQPRSGGRAARGPRDRDPRSTERASEAHAAIEDRSVPGKTLLVTGSRAR